MLSLVTVRIVVLTATGSGQGELVFYDGTQTEIGRFDMTVNGSTGTQSIGSLAAGTYIYFVLEEQNGCQSSLQTISVNVRTLPASPVVFNDSPVCEGESVHLQSSTTVGASYYWTGPNGFSSSLQSVTLNNVTTQDTGTYSVQVIVDGCASNATSTYVNVFPLPVISGGLTTNSPLCENDTLTINAPAVVDATYAWTGPNGFNSAGQNITINNVIETDHQGLYTVVVTDNNGCQSLPLSTLVLINALPDAGIALNSGPVCEGEEVQFTVLEIFNATYSWSGPNGFTSSIYNPTLTTTFADTGCLHG